MIPAEQHIRRLPAAKLGRPGILRAIQQAVLTKRLIHRRIAIAQHAFLETRYYIHHHGRGQFPAAQHKIPDREFLIGQMLGHALIHAFISAADQQQLAQTRKFTGNGLIELPALG